jgi:predicted DNA-binding transcriptional regulator AlpA
MKISSNKLLLTAKEVSEMLSLGKSTVYAYAEAGILNALRLPHTGVSKAEKRNLHALRFRLEDVQTFVDNCIVGGFTKK